MCGGRSIDSYCWEAMRRLAFQSIVSWNVLCLETIPVPSPQARAVF